MTVDPWLAGFAETVAQDGLRAQARALVRFVDRYAGHVATFIEARRDGEHQVVVLQFRTGKPQRSAYPILATERIGVRFSGEESLPLVVMLRDDFPDTEHQQLVPEGTPKAICIDDRPWSEARLTWTPAELIERILSWFGRAGRGELHDARQPIDPILFGSTLDFIVSRSILDSPANEDLVAVHDADHHATVRVRRFSEVGKPAKELEPLCILTYRVAPERMKRLKFAPGNLGSLSAMLLERDINLAADLTGRLGQWINDGQAAAWRLNARFAVIVEMPIVAPGGSQQPGTDLRAFVTAQSAGDVAVALGLAIKAQATDEGSKVGYVKAIGTPAADQNTLQAIEVQNAEVHLEFDRALATRLSGRSEPDARKAVLIGAGAIGSHLADCLVREGRFVWRIIDDDRLLPHNLARHTAHKELVAQNKAKIVARYLSGVLLDPGIASPIGANLLASGDARAEIDKALTGADLIIDASASLVAARHLADHSSAARRLSAFFNPSGQAAVLLAEPTGRSVTLRDLEAQYLGLLLRTPELGDHLTAPPETIAYTGACRAITNLIPQSNVMALGGLAASGLGKAADSPAGAIRVWSLQPTGDVMHHGISPEPVLRYTAHGWTITIDAGLIGRIRALRRPKLPAETGGVLFGLVDIPAKSIHVVEALPAPPDSIEKSDGFIRGTRGVQESIDEVRRKTAGQVRYIGEWHSHPPRTSAWPSRVDALQIDWLAALMDMDSMPALMLIAADNQVALIFANQKAVPSTAQDTGTGPGTGGAG